MHFSGIKIERYDARNTKKSALDQPIRFPIHPKASQLPWPENTIPYT